VTEWFGEACVAYSRYILDVGYSQDCLALQVALAPCLLGYAAAAQHLYNDAESVREENPYWKWIENYVADDYVQAVRKGSGTLRTWRSSRRSLVLATGWS
jgi:thiaminase